MAAARKDRVIRNAIGRDAPAAAHAMNRVGELRHCSARLHVEVAGAMRRQLVQRQQRSGRIVAVINGVAGAACHQVRHDGADDPKSLGEIRMPPPRHLIHIIQRVPVFVQTPRKVRATVRK